MDSLKFQIPQKTVPASTVVLLDLSVSSSGMLNVHLSDGTSIQVQLDDVSLQKVFNIVVAATAQTDELNGAQAVIPPIAP